MKINWKLKPFAKLSLQELYDIMVLRQAVFIVEQDCPYMDADGKDQKSHHFMGYDDKLGLVAYTRIVEPGVSYKEVAIGRVISSEKVRGKGVGIQLMELSIKQVNDLYGNVPIRIGAQCYLERFYRSFGFEPTGYEYLEDGIPHMEMLRN